MSMTPDMALGKDALSTFIDQASCNTFATSRNLKPVYEHLAAIAGVFDLAKGNLRHSASLECPAFLIRAYSCYLGAARLSTSGQIPEAYMVLRGCIENSLYAIHQHANPHTVETWLNRDVDLETRKKVRKEFANGPMLVSLEKVDKQAAEIARSLYEQTIDFGAHPNPYSILTQTTIEEDVHETRFSLRHLECGTTPHLNCLKTNAEVGLTSLQIFYQIFKEQWDILGIPERLVALRDARQFEKYKQFVPDQAPGDPPPTAAPPRT